MDNQDRVPRIQLNSPEDGVELKNLLQPGSVVPSEQYPGGRSVILEDVPDISQKKLVGERLTRHWELATVARPVDYSEKVYEVPTTRHIQTFVPKIQVREVEKTIPKAPTIIEKEVEVVHTKIVDKYVEVPVKEGHTVRHVPRIQVQERTVKVSRPEVKWVEKVLEVPQIKEVVRYVESDTNVEQVIRYIEKGQPKIDPAQLVQEYLEKHQGEEMMRAKHFPTSRIPASSPRPGSNMPYDVQPMSTPYVSTQQSGQGKDQSQYINTPRLNQVEQLFIPRVAKTVELQKNYPVAVDIPVPFMVPKPVQIPIEVPVIRFLDHFVPVPVRRHVIPKIIFTDEVYEVECAEEKPVLVVQDELTPVPVDVKIKLKEKDIKVIPVDLAELSQADSQALWMRVNADMLEQAKQEDRQIPYFDPNAPKEDGEVTDPAISADQLDLGLLPLHPGHPLMMTYLQAQWMQNPSTIMHNMYTSELFTLHASALDSLINPQPHQVNITYDQSLAMGPPSHEILPSPWEMIREEKVARRVLKKSDEEEEEEDLNASDAPESGLDTTSPRYSSCCRPVS